jgi:MFS family permease
MPGLDLFRERPFLLLFSARSLSVLGSAFGPVALTFGVLELPDATASTLSTVLTAQSVPMVLFVLIGGVVADRFSRRKVMVSADVMAGVAFSALATMFLTGWTPIPALMGAAALAGVSVALFYPALTGVVPEVVTPERLQTANGLLRLGTNTSRLLGFGLAGTAVAVIGAGWALVLNAAGFLVSALLLGGLRLPRRGRTATGSMLGDLRHGWREFSSRRWLWAIVVQFSFVVAAMQAAFGVLGPLAAVQSYDGARAWSAVLALQSLGTFLGIWVSVRFRPRRPLLVATIAVFAMAGPLTALGLRANIVIVLVAAFVVGVAFDVFGVLWETTMQREVPGEALSRVSAYDSLGSLMFAPVGLLAAAPLGAWLGTHAALLVCAGVIVVATAAALLAPEVRGLGDGRLDRSQTGCRGSENSSASMAQIWITPRSRTRRTAGRAVADPVAPHAEQVGPAGVHRGAPASRSGASAHRPPATGRRGSRPSGRG